MNELKPCPFCGGKAIVEGHHNRFVEWYLCSCPECHVSQAGNEYGFKFGAIEAWNRRTENVAPVVNWRWVTHYQSGTPVAEGYVSTCCDMWNNRKSPYCPNCGAKMDIEDGGDRDALN